MSTYKNLTDEQLQKEYRAIEAEVVRRQKIQVISKANNLTINGITCKDIAVRYGTSGGDSDDLRFSFYVKHGGKLHNIYYDHSTYDFSDGRDQQFHPWWPILPLEDGETEFDEWNNNGAREFIPNRFSEACENSYEYDGTLEEAIAHLKKYGITDVAQGDW